MIVRRRFTSHVSFDSQWCWYMDVVAYVLFYDVRETSVEEIGSLFSSVVSFIASNESAAVQLMESDG